ncbi:Germin-like protein [Sesamum alatum]|uniref:Germin-like protein n=1 Tax=Sesamum alatum TaxID=300844 RepID=A0AAE2CC55_9LAMI|nr:Germin-like protein [Sesamum alatum]
MVTPEDFLFFGRNKPKDTSNPLGSRVDPVTVNQLAGLNTLGISLACIDFVPYGLNPPHTHPRATEILVVIEGTFDNCWSEELIGSLGRAQVKVAIHDSNAAINAAFAAVFTAIAKTIPFSSSPPQLPRDSPLTDDASVISIMLASDKGTPTTSKPFTASAMATGTILENFETEPPGSRAHCPGSHPTSHHHRRARTSPPPQIGQQFPPFHSPTSGPAPSVLHDHPTVNIPSGVTLRLDPKSSVFLHR